MFTFVTQNLVMDYLQLFNKYKEVHVNGRYIALGHIEGLLQTKNRKNALKIIGCSVLSKPIYNLTYGTGNRKILMWSQMHGNESTTTKALFDLFNFLDSDEPFSIEIKRNFTIFFVPMLNPDGAEIYTRENADGIDLNRDAQVLSQPESQILRKLFDDYKPDFCFNLHDQRTIYGVGDSNLPATISLLAPAYNEARDFSKSRNTAISVICKINTELQKHIPGQVGRYDDSFNPNCVGDTFQMFGVPTILVEAGHYHEDYDREVTRKFVFMTYLTSFRAIIENVIVPNVFEDYVRIPLNKTSFLDIIYKNVIFNYDNTYKSINFGVQFVEKLNDKAIEFDAQIADIDIEDRFFGHKVYDCENVNLDSNLDSFLKIGHSATFLLANGTQFVNGLIII
jgi:hypothetical protein